jgi:hypothetical protein
MLICVDCRVEMTCAKNGMVADYGNGHHYAGDAYQCPECSAFVLTTAAEAYYDPERAARPADCYLVMLQPEEEALTAQDIADAKGDEEYHRRVDEGEPTDTRERAAAGLGR